MSRSNGQESVAPDPVGTPLGDLKRDAFEAASEEEQAFLLNLAAEFIEMLESVESAMAAKYAAQLFDIEEGLAFWSLLPSKVRTALKRGRNEQA
jgi:hypothetical protein